LKTAHRGNHMRVLVVEDHKELAATIAVGLRREGMAVDIVFDGRAALRHSARDSYDVIVLDRDLPKLHGDDVCRALARRSRPALTPILTSGDIRLDTVRRVASRAGSRLELSPKELAVLELLLAAGGAPVSTRELLDRGWDEYVDTDGKVVKVTISRLRRKLGDPPAIETVAHAGYRINA